MQTQNKELQKIYHKILSFLAIRPRSIHETKIRLKKYLQKAHFPPTLYQDIIKRLIALDLLDDYTFATWLIESRQRLAKRSKKHLYHELHFKHKISKDLIEQAFTAVAFDERKIIKKLISQNKTKSPTQLAQYLLRKGFPLSMIKEFLQFD